MNLTPLEYLSQQKFVSVKPGFDRILTLLEGLGHPERKLRVVHVAGTNGKGSVCACIASILREAGYRTGMYTSPYVTTWNEQLQINGRYISDGDFAEQVRLLSAVADDMTDLPSRFELETAMAFRYFADQHCDIVVVEVGMGGAWDATNVIPAPEIAVFTPIALDHTAILGNTVTEIAGVKSGIIKPGCDVVSSGYDPEAETVLEAACRRAGVRLFRPDSAGIRLLETSPEGQVFDYGTFRSLSLPLAGTYQPANAALAVEAARILRTRGWQISDAAIREGLRTVRWPGRYELLRRDPVFLLDGSHNPHGMEATVSALKTHFPGRKLHFLLGVMADKDVAGIARLLGPIAAAFYCVAPPNPRAMEPNALADLLRQETSCPAFPFSDIPEAVQALVRDAGPDGICAAIGSLYFSGQVRRAVESLI